MAEHTKGPWSAENVQGLGSTVIVSPSDAKPIACIVEREGLYVRHIHHQEPDGGTITRFASRTPETDAIESAAQAVAAANARLIAAAPELLEALKSLLAVAEATTFSDHFPLECEMAQAAIEKADASS